jgi:hypothetical protein
MCTYFFYSFLKLTPDHWCSVPELINFSHGEQQRFIRPVLSINNSLSALESCFMFDVDYKQVARELRLPQINETKNKIKLKSCDNGWIYDRTHYWDSAVMHVIVIYHNQIEVYFFVFI